MIKANELRIVSWAIGAYGEPMQVGIVTKHENDLQPIPLTHEILITCGFEKNGAKELNDRWMIGWDEGGGYLQVEKNDKGRFYYVCETFLIRHITSLHQLQNLYFALTGEELNYKPLKL